MSEEAAERAAAGPSRAAIAGLAAASDAVARGSSTCERLVAPATPRLARIHRAQVEREPWPDFAVFDRGRYDLALRREAAGEWARRAVAEHGSIHQFSALSHALCEARVGLELLGPLARLITDEVRHAELCARMALAIDPEGPTARPGDFAWPIPQAPWAAAPDPGAREAALAWAAEVMLVACCLGETLSRPMYDALIVRCTDPIAEAVLRQIQRDEHLHAAFGWDALALLLPALEASGRARLEGALRRAFGGFEATTACGIEVAALAGTTLEVRRGEGPNLGTMDAAHYATIFFATIEREIFPALAALGFDPAAAWRERSRPGRR